MEGFYPLYPNTCRWIRQNVPEFHHAFWMVQQIEQHNDGTLKGALKAARWIGYALREAEESGYLTNEQSRDLVRADVTAGADH